MSSERVLIKIEQLSNGILNISEEDRTLDGETITARSNHNRTIQPCVKTNGVWADYDFSAEEQDIQNVCSSLWTEELKTQFKSDQDAGSLV